MNGTRAKGGTIGAIAALLIAAALGAASLDAKPKGKKEGPEAVSKGFDIVTLVTGLRKPTAFDFLPDGTMLVAE
jgi:glucose/arabinose dehydrogenase